MFCTGCKTFAQAEKNKLLITENELNLIDLIVVIETHTDL